MIDEQHQTWISRYNSVLDAIEERHGAEIVSKILGFLVDYTETHFAAEEARMEETDYPDQAEHKAKHKELLETLMDSCRISAKTDPPKSSPRPSIPSWETGWSSTSAMWI